MKKRIIAGLIAIIAIMMFAGCVEEEGPISTPMITPSPTATPAPTLETTSAIVSRVIDGDTIKLQEGERVRLLGIDAPERGQPYYEELEMVREGNAKVYIRPPNTKYSDILKEAEEEAKNAERGLWQPSE